MRILILLFWSTLVSFSTLGYYHFPKDYFTSPVKGPIRLSGTFGELRPNHLHAGIDIKGSVGQSLYAAANGYISRIKVQKDGYGKVLYIRHPNGYTSVYAHMNSFEPEVEAYVKSIQYEKKQFEVEIYPAKGKFSYQKGQKIGTMGVTGRSFGPHLHFEIRNTRSEKPLNPLLFNFVVEDTRSPRLHNLRLYYLDNNAETIEKKTFSLIRRKNGDYRVSGDTLTVPASNIGLALKAYDHMNGVSNWNGVYSLKVLENDNSYFEFKMDSFSFKETRYINAHLDYEDMVTDKSYFNRCYLLPGNKLSVYSHDAEKGIIQLEEGKSTKVSIEVSDIEGNISTLEFWLKFKPIDWKPNPKTYNYILAFEEENLIQTPSVRIHFPKESFYQKTYFNYSFSVDHSEGIYSSVHHIHNFKTPVHKYFDLSIWPNRLPKELSPKAIIVYCSPEGELINCGGKWEGDMLKTKARWLGDYFVTIDTTAPTVTPVVFKADMRGMKKMSFQISDNFQAAGNVNGLDYFATIDGKWILMEHDEKNNTLEYWFEKEINTGEHRFLLVVSDHSGNKKIYDRIFIR